MDHSTLIEKAHTYLDNLTTADQFSGAVLIAFEKQTILTTACGYAIHPNVLPNQPDTKFNLASVTKMLTAAAVMKLVSEQKLELHTPISAYDPLLPHADQITIHQLLIHTAGFDRYWNDAYRAARSDLRTIADYLKLFDRLPLEFSPGTRHHYGNTGYVVLGALIEQVTGMSYYDYMRRAIYSPLGMHNTDHYEMDLPIDNLAVGYTTGSWYGPNDGQRRANHYIYAVKGSPSEHCFSTVQDLFLFTQALQEGRLFGANYANLCFTSHLATEKPEVSYGYGVHIIDDGKHGRVIGHGGRALGGDAFALIYRDLGYTVIVLSNYDRPAARRVVDYIADLLIE